MPALSDAGMRASVPAVVLDCVIYVQAAISTRGPAAQCLEAAEAGHLRLIASEAILAELTDVLRRPEFVQRRPHLTPDYVTAFVSRVRRTALVIHPVEAVFTFARDPNDEPYLNLVIASEANYLVSRDRDLLDLDKPDSESGRDLRRILPDIAIMDPVELLQRIAPVDAG